MHSLMNIVKVKVAVFLSCLIIGIVACSGWPWNGRLSLIIDRLDQIQEAWHGKK